MSKAWWLLVVTCALGCGSDSSGKTDAGNPKTDGRPADSKPIDGAAKVFMDGPPGTTPLTVKNYDAWCSVTVNGGAPSAALSQLVNVDPGTITLTAASSNTTLFKLGLWHHTDGDSGSGDAGMVSNGTSTAMVTVGATSTCVWVCCPFLNGTGCPTLDQCP